MIRYDEHAEFQIERRGIAKQWVEDTLLSPDETETQHGRRSPPDVARPACYAAPVSHSRGTTHNTLSPPISTGQSHADESGSCGGRGTMLT